MILSLEGLTGILTVYLSAEVTEHHIPVFAQQCSRLGQYEPVVEVVENANACSP